MQSILKDLFNRTLEQSKRLREKGQLQAAIEVAFIAYDIWEEIARLPVENFRVIEGGKSCEKVV